MSETAAATKGRMTRKFNRTARDIDRALAAARLSPLKAFLVQRAREASWTTATLLKTAAVPFRLNIKVLATLLDVRADTLAECHDWLVAAGIFAPAEGHPGLYLIAKDFRSWRDPKAGTPLLPDALADDAAEARTFALKGVESWARLATPARKNPGISPEKSGSESRKNPETSRKNPEDLRKNPGPPGPPYKERGRDQSPTELQSLTEQASGPREPIAFEAKSSESPATLPLSGPSEAADRFAARIAERFREAPDDNDGYYRREALMWLAHHPEPVVSLALGRALGETTSKTGRGLCHFVPSLLAKAARDVGRAAPAPSKPAPPAPALSPEEEAEELAIVARIAAKARERQEHFAATRRRNASA